MTTDYKKMLDACPLVEKESLAEGKASEAFASMFIVNGKLDRPTYEQYELKSTQYRGAVNATTEAALDAQPELRNTHDAGFNGATRALEERDQMREEMFRTGQGNPGIVAKDDEMHKSAETVNEARSQARKNLKDYCSTPTS